MISHAGLINKPVNVRRERDDKPAQADDDLSHACLFVVFLTHLLHQPRLKTEADDMTSQLAVKMLLNNEPIFMAICLINVVMLCTFVTYTEGQKEISIYT